MIRLTESFQARRRKSSLPQRALQLLESLEQQSPAPYDYRTHSRVALMEEGDNIERVPREFGRYGLLEVLDNPWRSYDSIHAFAEGEERFFEIVVTLTPGVLFYLLVPDAPWLDCRLRLVLDVETGEQDTG